MSRNEFETAQLLLQGQFCWKRLAYVLSINAHCVFALIGSSWCGCRALRACQENRAAHEDGQLACNAAKEVLLNAHFVTPFNKGELVLKVYG